MIILQLFDVVCYHNIMMIIHVKTSSLDCFARKIVARVPTKTLRSFVDFVGESE